MMEIAFKLHLLSVFMVDAGPGGTMDRCTTIDQHGLPCVPASSLRGLVKAAIRGHLMDNPSGLPVRPTCNGQLRPGSTDYCPDIAACPLCRIFGAPGIRERGWDFTGARYSQDARQAAEEALGDNLTSGSLLARPRNQRDEELRRAREDHFFTDGAGIAFFPLEGRIIERPSCARGEADRRQELQLLLLGLRLVRELGSSRNRGYGQCLFEPVRVNSLAGTEVKWQDELRAYCRSWTAGCGKGAA